MKRAPRGRKITRMDAADIFYNKAKLKRFYNGRIPQTLTLAEVHNRLELYTKEGTRRKIQGKAVVE